MKRAVSFSLTFVFLILLSACGRSATATYAFNTAEKFGWNLILVNPWNKLPEDFDVELIELRNGFYVDRRIYPYLQEMFDDARLEGIYPLIVSAYRSDEMQNELYNEKYIIISARAIR